ncbi:MAG TPA: VOC family protein [Candidatus Dormibacteraeota bacterium]|nr:VOC family protein [Candidatus Dormibacteraeota bacterium]
MAIKLGVVGHFGLAVRDPKASARWWIEKLNLRHEFDYPGGVAVGNDAVTIALFKGEPHPETIAHVSFHLDSLRELQAALRDLRRKGVEMEDPGDEIGPEAPGSPHLGLWFHDLDGYRWELSVQNALRRTTARPSAKRKTAAKRPAKKQTSTAKRSSTSSRRRKR